MLESEIQKRLQIAASQFGSKLFRNNVGVGWTGSIKKRLPDGTIIIANARPLHAGLFTGSGDLIGWRTITITPDMVGKRIAVFTSVEVKQNSGRATPDQVHWMNRVNESGGIAGIVKTEHDMMNLLSKKLL